MTSPRRTRSQRYQSFHPDQPPAGTGSGQRSYRIRATLVGAGALAWLLFRSGTKPSRLGYPCQQSAFGLAVAVFGAPLVVALVAGRSTLARFMRTPAGWLSGGALGVLALLMMAVASSDSALPTNIASPPPDYHPDVFLVNEARGILPGGRYGGVDDLIQAMGAAGLKWHRSAASGLTSGPSGLIDRDDVVLIKINAQWPERGGTNTDVLRGVIRRIVEHPEGFVGEVVVADNGQGYGNLNRTQNNAEDIGQSPRDVADDFANEGWHVSTRLWDTLRYSSVGEYSTGDMNDGYVVNSVADPESGVRVSYPKFRTSFGTYVSYKHGIWSAATDSYDAERLVVLNLPVLKTHSIYAVTAAVKNHMGVVTQSLGTDSHNCVATGGLGSVMAEVRTPDLNILDCIWILARPGLGPRAYYEDASRRDQFVASTDPVALDVWAVKHVLMPQIIANGYSSATYGSTQDPDNPAGVFRRYLDLSMNELLAGGVDVTNDYDAVDLTVWAGPAVIPAVSTWGLIVLTLLLVNAAVLIGLRRAGTPVW